MTVAKLRRLLDEASEEMDGNDDLPVVFMDGDLVKEINDVTVLYAPNEKEDKVELRAL